MYVCLCVYFIFSFLKNVLSDDVPSPPARQKLTRQCSEEVNQMSRDALLCFVFRTCVLTFYPRAASMLVMLHVYQ